MMAHFTKPLEALLAQSPDPHNLWVAYSGGLDSTFLLHLLASSAFIKDKYHVKALHVDHGLHPESGHWAKQCVLQAKTYGIPCEVISLSLTPKQLKGESLEAVARDARYDALKKCVTKGDVLLTAHHQDDQVETVLLQLLRGAGAKGLSGMPERTSFGKGILIRPFLSFSKGALEAAARDANLNWRDDPSNQNDQFNRNYLRQHVIPLLKARWPGMGKTVSRSATHIASDHTLLTRLLEKDLHACRGIQPGTLSIKALMEFDDLTQRHILRQWIKANGLPLPDTRTLRRLQHEMLSARIDKQPHVGWKGGECRRFKGDLYALSPSGIDTSNVSFTWHLDEGPLNLPFDLGQLMAFPVKGAGFPLPKGSSLICRFRKGGERFHLKHQVGSRPLKKHFQDWGVPPWERGRIPLLFYQDTLISVPRFGECHPQKLSPNETGFLFLHTPAPKKRSKK